MTESGSGSKRWLYISVGVIVLYWVIFAIRRVVGAPDFPSSVAAIAFNVSIRTVISLGIVWVLLRANGDRVRDLGFAPDGTGRFLLRTVLLSVGLFVLANVVLNSLLSAVLGRSGAPPIAALFGDTRELPYWIFCALVGGGFTEELTRAFTLTRFEKLFGRAGLVVALIVDSVVFGLGHLYQGRAVAVSSAITGLILGLIFLRRRRVIDAMAVHALFDLMGIAGAYALYAR
jgi:membrane protease YdiL (CAAX protease family)